MSDVEKSDDSIKSPAIVSVIHEGLPTQLPDIDPDETQEWLAGVDPLRDDRGRGRARDGDLRRVLRAKDLAAAVRGRERLQRATAEILGVGEEQWGVVAVDDQAGNLSGERVIVDVMHSGDPRDVAEDAVVRAGDPAQQVGDRQRDRHQHP